MGIFGDMFGDAGKEAAERNRQLAANYRTTGLGYLDSGLASSKGYLDRAVDSFTPVSDLGAKYGGATTLALDALGVHGADGNARATAAFQAAPGYQFVLDQGLEALNRRKSAAGMSMSGNADADAMRLGAGLADQGFQKWLGNLTGFTSPELSATAGAATGQAAGLGSLANLYQTDAANRIGLEGGYTSGMMSANNQEAEARSKGAGNLLGLGMNLLSLGTGGLGGLGGMGSMFNGGSMGLGAFNPGNLGALY